MAIQYSGLIIHAFIHNTQQVFHLLGDELGFDGVLGEVDVQGAVGVAFFDLGERVIEFGQDLELVVHGGKPRKGVVWFVCEGLYNILYNKLEREL